MTEGKQDRPPRRRLKAAEMQLLDRESMFGKAMGDFKLSRDPGLELECIALEKEIQGRLALGGLHIEVAQHLRYVADKVQAGDPVSRTVGRLLHDAVMDLLDAGHTGEAIAIWLRSAAAEVDEQAPRLPQ